MSIWIFWTSFSKETSKTNSSLQKKKRKETVNKV
ncbi:hypothetical protein HRED_10022 [Candidatus Haloredivivus sp. G17]|nr:hypothetical protein HRED_10022 [Candidatus Haloredivivus sp. G17]